MRHRKTLAFCVDIAHSKKLSEAFQAAGVRSEAVWGIDPDREKKLDMHASGEIDVLTNCAFLTEGYDDPSIQCVLLGRPTQSPVLYPQMVGRGLRIVRKKDGTFQLLPPQVEAIECIMSDLSNGLNKLLLVLPTGVGKTVVIAQLPKLFKRRIMFLVHTDELASQAVATIKAWNLTERVGMEMGDSYASVNDRIVVASVQTLGRQGSSRLAFFKKEDFDVIAIDEAHHATSETYQRIIKHFGLDMGSIITNRLLLGVTATPKRGDGSGLGNVFEKISFQYSILQAVKDGYLVNPIGLRISTNTRLDNVATQAGDLNLQQLSLAVNTPGRNRLIVESWLEHATTDTEEKTDCLIMDVADNGARHSLMSIGTLFGLPAKLKLNDKNVLEAVEDFEKAQLTHPEVNFSQLEDLNDVTTFAERVSLLSDTPPEEVAESPYRWYKTALGTFHLALPNNEQVRIWADILDRWYVAGTIRGSRIAEKAYKSFEGALYGAEQIIQTLGGRELNAFIKRESKVKWLKDPIADHQSRSIERLCIRLGKAVPDFSRMSKKDGILVLNKLIAQANEPAA